ncbi:alpha-protein kinase 3-like [Falco peregrinus]|uniref:alpha-protein kinase 3-like n=1 Tax=Falco peregrinus TaxID=8954 RepID=UPI002479A4FE|nr:alpha-protein kinase 3-like [Falco peregrinus]
MCCGCAPLGNQNPQPPGRPPSGPGSQLPPPSPSAEFPALAPPVSGEGPDCGAWRTAGGRKCSARRSGPRVTSVVSVAVALPAAPGLVVGPGRGSWGAAGAEGQGLCPVEGFRGGLCPSGAAAPTVTLVVMAALAPLVRCLDQKIVLQDGESAALAVWLIPVRSF